jgi:beta-galactosidase
MADMPRSGRPHWPGRPIGIAYGGDYNPEQWPESTWLEDVRLMAEAGVNLVTVGVFSWSRLQPGPDTWDFGWLDRVLDLLAAHDIAVDLATATASPPPWFSLRHPESLPVTSSGTRLGIGGRQHLCPSSPVFREAAARLVARLAHRYGKHPAVVMWHIGNEYADHVQQCFCDTSAAGFREWLVGRYGTLEALNEAWTADVWSGRFGDWAEIMPPRDAPSPLNPALLIDWRRFSSDALLACYENERAILSRLTPGLPVTTNFMRLNDGVDHRRWAGSLDLVSADLYPDPADPSSRAEAALSHDLMRSLGDGRPWLLMEQARSAVDWRPVNMPRRPEEMRALSIAAVGRGADGVLFFQWRGSRGGPEAFHSAMLPVGGTATRGWRTTVALGADLRRLGEVAGSSLGAKTAVLIDWDSWWALDAVGHPSERLRYRDQVLAWHRPLHAANLATDVRGPGDDLSGYRLVIAPNLFLLDEAAAANLDHFVRGGGVLVVGPFSGVVDRDHRLPAGPHPALLRDLLGVTWEEVWPIADGESVAVRFASEGSCRAVTWRDAIDLAGAEAVAVYADGELEGWPAVTRRARGSGEAWYVGAVLDEHGVATVIEHASRAAGVEPVANVPPGVEAIRRTSPRASYLFLVNHGPANVAVPIPGGGLELLGGSRVEPGESIVLGLSAAAVVRTSGAG